MKRRITKVLHEGAYFAEVEIELVHEHDDPWGPTMSREDALKLDAVRLALRRDDLASATRLARVYAATPIAG